MAAPVVTAGGCTAPLVDNPDYTAGSQTVAPCIVSTVVTTTGEGSITVTAESSPSNGTEIAYNTTKGVMALKIKATSSDMALNRIDFNFNKRAWLYVEKAGLYDGSILISEKVLTSSSFDEIASGANYRLRFDGLNYVVAKDATKILTLKLTTPSIISDVGTPVTVTFDTNSVRATDTTGLITYEGVAATRTFSVETATNGKLAASLDTTSPKVGTMIVDDIDTINDKTLLVFGLKATEDNVNVSSIPVVLDVGLPTATTTSSAQIANALHLFKDGASISTGIYASDCDDASDHLCTVTFDSLDLDIAKDATTQFTVKGNIKPVDGNIVTAGDVVKTTLTVASIVAEDSNYHTVTTLTGSAEGAYQHLFVNAPILTFVSVPSSEGASVSTSGSGTTQTGTFEVKFTVKAEGSDIYIDPNMTATSTPVVTAMTFDGVNGSPALNLVTSADLSSGGLYRVPANGASVTFTVQGVIVGGNVFDGIFMTGLGYALTDGATDGTAYVDWGLADFKSPTAYLAN